MTVQVVTGVAYFPRDWVLQPIDWSVLAAGSKAKEREMSARLRHCAKKMLNALPRSVRSFTEVDSRQNYSRVHTSNLTEFVSASLWLNIFSVILKSLELRHVNDDSNTN